MLIPLNCRGLSRRSIDSLVRRPKELLVHDPDVVGMRHVSVLEVLDYCCLTFGGGNRCHRPFGEVSSLAGVPAEAPESVHLGRIGETDLTGTFLFRRLGPLVLNTVDHDLGPLAGLTQLKTLFLKTLFLPRNDFSSLSHSTNSRSPRSTGELPVPQPGPLTR